MNTDFCTNYPTLYIFSILRKSFRVLLIIIPLIIIVIGMIDFFKAVLDKDDDSIKKATNALIKRIIAGIVIFIMPTLVESLFNVFNESFIVPLDLSSCIENSDNLAFYKELYEKEKKNQISKDERENEIEAERLRKEAEKKKENSKKYFIPRYNPSTPDGGSNTGRKYNISDSDIKALAVIAKCEQGSVQGARAEAELMVNRYELYGSSFSNIYDYVTKGSFFHCGHCYAGTGDNCEGLELNKEPGDSYVSVVRSVVKNGDRTLLAPYVDEHDNFGDISKIVNNGSTGNKENKNEYVRDKTIIYTYGDKGEYHYKFYSFPCPNCDPFGYTNSAYNEYQKNQDKPNYVD